MVYQRSLRERAFVFSQEILAAYNVIGDRGPQFAHMADQLFRSSTAIGALLEEGDVAASRRDMGAKHAIALREAKEARYWLRLIIAAKVDVERLTPLEREANEFVAMLTTSVRKLRG